MAMRTMRSGGLMVITVALAYACGDNTTPIPRDGGGTAGLNGAGMNPGGAVNGGDDRGA